jgi:Kef-type K+ transport system membrane component KefB
MLNIAYTFLVPIFFVNIGLLVNLREISLSALPFAGALLLIAVLAKVGGVGAGARLGGFTEREAMRVGTCMISRGEVSLIVASLGLAQGVFDNQLFSSLFLVVLLTALLTPPLVRWVFRPAAST